MGNVPLRVRFEAEEDRLRQRSTTQSFTEIVFPDEPSSSDRPENDHLRRMAVMNLVDPHPVHVDQGFNVLVGGQ